MPESEEALAALYLRIAREPVPDLRLRGVPDSVCRVIEAAMAKDPVQRPPSAAQLGHALQEAQMRAGLPVTEMSLTVSVLADVDRSDEAGDVTEDASS